MLRRISPPKISKKESGFTLIEMMIVLIIVAAVVTFALPRIDSRANKMKSAVRKLSVLARQTHNAARLSGRTFRIVVSMTEGKSTTLWVESAAVSGAVLETIDDKDKDRRKDEETKSAFQMDTTIMRSPWELPSPLAVEDVELGSRDKVISSGKAYIHFLPQGFTDDTAIHLTDRKDARWTLRIHPLTGQAEVVGRHYSLKELKAE